VAVEGRLEPEIVERGRPELARERQQLLQRLVGERPDLGELAGELGRRLLAGRLESQQQSRERLVDLVVQIARDSRALLLLRLQRRTGGAAALGLEALEHPDERVMQPLDLLGAARALGEPEVRSGAGEVGALHLVDEVLERLEAALKQEQIEDDRRQDREPQHDEGRGPFGEAPARVRGDDRGDERDGDQQQVDRHHLRHQITPPHGIKVSAPRGESRLDN
jgi:hypothetical protein